MARDLYKGIPKVVDSFIDGDGNTRLRNGSGNNFGAYVVGSGTLTGGYGEIDGATIGINVGWHTHVLLTSISGSYNTERMQVEMDVANNVIRVSGADSDDSRFSYFIINPGLASPKIS